MICTLNDVIKIKDDGPHSDCIGRILAVHGYILVVEWLKHSAKCDNIYKEYERGDKSLVFEDFVTKDEVGEILYG